MGIFDHVNSYGNLMYVGCDPDGIDDALVFGKNVLLVVCSFRICHYG